MNVEKGHCQRKVEYFARTPNSYFAAIDFPRFFRIDPSGSTATSSIQNFPLTIPKKAINWTRLSCHSFRNNEVRLQLHALAYNLGNFLRTLALSQEVEHWSLTTLRNKLIKIGAKVVRHGRYVTFQLAEVAISRSLFAEILRLIDRLRPAPLPP